MKFSTAVIALCGTLTVGTVGASIGTRQGRRRLAADAAAADNDATVPDSDQDRRLGEGYSTKCEEEEIEGIVHLSFTGGDKHVDNESEEAENPISTGFGGFAFRYDSSRGQSVAFKSAAGSNFDPEACMEYKKEKTDAGCQQNPGRRLPETADATVIYPDTAVNTDADIEADADIQAESHGGGCDGYDTILYCPMKPGQCATFQLTDTLKYCTCTSSGQWPCPPMPEMPPGEIGLEITTPGIKTSDSDPSTCSNEDAVAAFQCAPSSKSDFEQTSACLYGNDNESLGAGYRFKVQTCEIIDPQEQPE